jgi:hypothetical protein
MRSVPRLLVPVIAVILTVSSCGSDSSSSGEANTGAAGGAGFTSPAHHDSGGGIEQFKTKGGDNSIQESGEEASDPEFEEAAAALHAYLDARAAGAWARACEYLAPGATTQLAQIIEGGETTTCAGLLPDLSASIPLSALRRAAVANIGSFRVDGDAGFLLFRGAGGVAYFVPMAREDGRWTVAALAPSPLP